MFAMMRRPPPCRRLGTSSMGSLREPTVMAVRASKDSTGFMDAGVPQAFISTELATTAIKGRRISGSIPGREPEPIIELRLPGILLAMVKRFGRFCAASLGTCLVLATVAALRTTGAYAADGELAERVVVPKSEHKLYLYSGEPLMARHREPLGLRRVARKERDRAFRTPEGDR